MSELQPGLRHTHTITVTKEYSPRHLAPAVVLSTPSMIGFMERAATLSVQPLLGEQTTVGTHVNVSHEAAARDGQVVTFEATLTSVEGRRLEFDVLARIDNQVIGRGTHQRTIVNSGFGRITQGDSR